ncbi:MAG: hypothetical protein HXX20_06850 [Chloroflexi bacterium]|nr:hypothetical protein [Chloroflexota bacterium]
MFELDKTLDQTTLTWIDRTYRTEQGLRRFLATLTPAQLAEAEVLVDDDTFVVFYPVVVAVKKAGRQTPFHFDLTEGSESLPLSQGEEEDQKTECVRDFNTLLAGVKL